MKRFLPFVVALFLAAISSCESTTEIAMEYQLTADINPVTIIKNMKGANNNDFFTSDDNQGVTITSYIYDENYDLVEERQVVTRNFYDTAQFKSSLVGGTYTVVYTVCINDNDGYPIWSVNNKSSLSNLSYTVRDGWNEWAHVLGVSKKSIEIKGSKEISVDVESVGAFTTMAFTYGDDSNAAYLYVTGDKRSIGYSIYNRESTIYTASEGYYAWSDEVELSSEYSGTTLCYFFLPIDDMRIKWKSYDSKTNVIKSGEFYYDFEMGVNSTLITNIDTGVTTKSVDIEESNYSDGFNKQMEK